MQKLKCCAWEIISCLCSFFADFLVLVHYRDLVSPPLLLCLCYFSSFGLKPYVTIKPFNLGLRRPVSLVWLLEILQRSCRLLTHPRDKARGGEVSQLWLFHPSLLLASLLILSRRITPHIILPAGMFRLKIRNDVTQVGLDSKEHSATDPKVVCYLQGVCPAPVTVYTDS